MRTWLVTGCSSGFGEHLAHEILARGDRVVVTARRLDDAKRVAATGGDRAIPLSLDVEDGGSVRAAVGEALAWSGGIDVLVNNAGRGFHGAAEEVTDAESRALFDTNVFGLMEVTRAVLTDMRRKRNGHVVNIGSVSGLAGDAGTGHYSASKFALEGLSEAMSVELAPLGIKVTIVEPGPFRTDFNGRSASGAASPIADYAETAGKRAAALRAGTGKQPGDPSTAARLICDIVESPNPPLHVLVGSVALQRWRAKQARFEADIAAWEEQARATDFDVHAA